MHGSRLLPARSRLLQCRCPAAPRPVRRKPGSSRLRAAPASATHAPVRSSCAGFAPSITSSGPRAQTRMQAADSAHLPHSGRSVSSGGSRPPPTDLVICLRYIVVAGSQPATSPRVRPVVGSVSAACGLTRKKPTKQCHGRVSERKHASWCWVMCSPPGPVRPRRSLWTLQAIRIQKARAVLLQSDDVSDDM